MKLSNTKSNILKNGIATVGQKLVRVFEQLLLVPFYIDAWGPEYYGEWISLTVVPSFLALSDFGLGSATSNTFVLRFTSGNHRGAADVAKSGIILLSIVTLASLVVGLLLLLFFKESKFASSSIIPSGEAITAVTLLTLISVLNFFQQLFEGYYRSMRRAALSTNLLSAYSAITLFANALVLMNSGNIVNLAFSSLAVCIIFNLVYAIVGIKILRIDPAIKGHVNKKDVKIIFNLGLGYLISPLWQGLYFQGTTLVVRLALGPAAVAGFNTVRTLTRSVNQAYSLVNGSIFPELQFEIGSNHLEKARKLFRTALIAVFLVAIFGTATLLLFGEWFYLKWTQNTLTVPRTMLNLFVLSVAFNGLWWTASMTFRAANKPLGFALVGLLSSLLSICATYILARRFGLVGAAAGTLILDVVMTFYVVPMTCKILGQSLKCLIPNLWTDGQGLYLKAKRRINNVISAI